MAGAGCFKAHDGEVHAILNWRFRAEKDDVVIAARLNPREQSLYDKYKEEGRADGWIFEALFPSYVPAVGKTEVDIALLNKKQLVYLIISKLGVSLPSLMNMSLADLQQLLPALNAKR